MDGIHLNVQVHHYHHRHHLNRHHLHRHHLHRHHHLHHHHHHLKHAILDIQILSHNGTFVSLRDHVQEMQIHVTKINHIVIHLGHVGHKSTVIVDTMKLVRAHNVQ